MPYLYFVVKYFVFALGKTLQKGVSTSLITVMNFSGLKNSLIKFIW